MEIIPIFTSALKSCAVLTPAFDSPPPPAVFLTYFGVYLFITQVLLRTINEYRLCIQVVAV